eukprot:70719_1
MGTLFTYPGSFALYAIQLENSCRGYTDDYGMHMSKMEFCRQNSHCLWCNETAHCFTIQEYCTDTTICNSSQAMWPPNIIGDDGEEWSPHSCESWIIAFTFSLLLCTLICCIMPWCTCIIMVKKGSFSPNAKERAVLILSFICMIVISITCVIMTLANNDFELYRQIWAWCGLCQYLIVLPVTAVLYFGMTSYRIIMQLIFYGKASVHSMCLVFIYILWWIIFFTFIAMIPYFIVSKDI